MSQFNDGFVNFPMAVYISLQKYIQEWRQGPYNNDDVVLVWPETLRPVTSSDLGRICKVVFKGVNNGKDFVFTDFRQYLQSVFAQTCGNDEEKKWFNRVVGHSDAVGKRYYEMAMAPGYHAQMGAKIEHEMVQREVDWKNDGMSPPVLTDHSDVEE